MSSWSDGADSLIGFTRNVATVPTTLWTAVRRPRLRDYDAGPLQKPSSFVVHAAMASVSVLFAINYIISKIGMHVFNPLTFAYLRVLAAAIILNTVLRERNAAPLEPGDGRRLFGFSILGVVINQTLFLAGLALTTAHAAAILITTIPIFALAAAIALGRESPTAVKVGGIALSAAGAIVLVGGEGFSGTTKSLIGDLMIVVRALSRLLETSHGTDVRAPRDRADVRDRIDRDAPDRRMADDARAVARDSVRRVVLTRIRDRWPHDRRVPDERVGAEVCRKLGGRRVHVPTACVCGDPRGDFLERAA
jgi:uncharacterized membrane protein